MFWLTWRQHRIQLLSVLAVLIAVGVVLLLTGLEAIEASGGRVLTRCGGGALGCTELDGGRDAIYQQVEPFVAALPGIPLLAGIFWGAPLLSREFERGTYRLAWTQSVGRLRWLSVKLAVLGSAAAVAGLISGQLLTAWLRLFPGKAETFAEASFFGTVGVASVAWWVFAFVLGTAAGVLTRKLLPAIAVTVGVFLVVVIGLFLLRPYYAEPVRTVGATESTKDALILYSGRIGPDGREYASLQQIPECPAGPGVSACLDAAGYRDFAVYQPGDRFWQFQWTEAGILLAATVLLGGVAASRIRPVSSGRSRGSGYSARVPSR